MSCVFCWWWQIPPITDYNVSDGQTYRYLHDEPLYPFGYGLSYSHFDYSNISVSPSVITAGQNVCVAVDVTNRGPYEADEVSFDTLFSPQLPCLLSILHTL